MKKSVWLRNEKSIANWLRIKSTKIASWRDINPLIEKLSVGNKIGHLFVVELCFNERKHNEKT